MMRDEIFYGNLMGLLKTGKWTMNASESAALIQILQEIDRRLKPPSVVKDIAPVIKEKRAKNVRNK